MILGQKVDFQKIPPGDREEQMKKFLSEKSYNCVRYAQKKFERNLRQKIILSPKQVFLSFGNLKSEAELQLVNFRRKNFLSPIELIFFLVIPNGS